MDTSPLVQTRAGTARYVRGLLRHLDVDGTDLLRKMNHGDTGDTETHGGR